MQYDPNVPLPKPKMNAWKALHRFVSLPIVLRPCQHVVHALPNICCRLVDHQKIRTQIF
jgi:hypothetical protein